MKETAFFIDTSYMLEFYRVPGRSEPHAVTEVRRRFKHAWERGHVLFLPAVCVLELGNAIAQVTNVADRQKLAKLLRDNVSHCLSNATARQFTILDAPALEQLPALLESWSQAHIEAPRGLVDAAVAERAASFKKARTGTVAVKVHIWTRDRRLKAVEPDPEPDPFI